ncbi:ComEC/Rec2 family competence protein [Bacillus gobiensis]|uniref:ComEC/Rec2 family competence protein n=1 Tax=Bacillus gobiensis TaxID=1441095 RepID=UPI003D1C7DD9
MKKLKIFLLSLVVVLAIPNISATQVTAASKNLVVHYIDIGQGDAIYIKTPKGDDIIIDAGNKAKGDDVVKYLKKQKVDDIEVMIATHPDADHVGGLDEVLSAYRVENIYAPKVSHTTQAYKDFLQAVKREKKTIKTAKNGVALAIKDKSIKTKFIGPVKDYSKSDLNNWSAVVHIQYNKNSFLFTGDAELKSEKDMLSKKLLSKVDVLKVGHHGSKDSSSKDFLNKVKPTYAVISVGKGNRYKHPTSETLNRLKAVKAKVYRTDKNGTVKVTSSGTKISVSPAKK